jgi:hypothetical protein
MLTVYLIIGVMSVLIGISIYADIKSKKTSKPVSKFTN